MELLDWFLVGMSTTVKKKSYTRKNNRFIPDPWDNEKHAQMRKSNNDINNNEPVRKVKVPDLNESNSDDEFFNLCKKILKAQEKSPETVRRWFKRVEELWKELRLNSRIEGQRWWYNRLMSTKASNTVLKESFFERANREDLGQLQRFVTKVALPTLRKLQTYEFEYENEGGGRRLYTRRSRV